MIGPDTRREIVNMMYNTVENEVTSSAVSPRMSTRYRGAHCAPDASMALPRPMVMEQSQIVGVRSACVTVIEGLDSSFSLPLRGSLNGRKRDTMRNARTTQPIEKYME